MRIGIVTIASSMIVGLLACAQSAKASSMSYVLSTGNTAISGYTGPYGTVNVTLSDSTHATVTFTGDTVGNYTFLFGGSQMADVNVNASSFSLSVSTPGTTTGYGSKNISGFGAFNAAVNNHAGSTYAVNSVIFNITDLSGSWADVSDVLAANANGYTVAAHIFVKNPNNTTVCTGYAANGQPGRPVPDGASTMTLLGLAMVGIGSVRRMVSRKK